MPDPHKAIYATGRRKQAVARVWLQPGSGKVIINQRTLEDYFGRETSRMVFRQALELTETTGQHGRVRECRRRRSVGTGGRDSPRHLARADQDRSRVPPAAEKGRLPDARRARQRAQEVRPAWRPRPLPVLEALKRRTLVRGRCRPALAGPRVELREPPRCPAFPEGFFERVRPSYPQPKSTERIDKEPKSKPEIGKLTLSLASEAPSA